MKKIISLCLLAGCLSACLDGGREEAEEGESHNLLFKEYLQGVWVDDFTEQPILKVQGDSIYTAGRFDVALHFEVKKDTLIVNGSEATTYYIKHLEESSFQFYTSIGDLMSLHKADADVLFGELDEPSLPEAKPEVIEKDSVIVFQGKRFRGYSYINPSTKKVVRPRITEEGLIVDKVYFDHVIHICVYQGAEKLYSKDIHKEMLEGVVPDDFLNSSILADMNFVGVSSKGFHYRATVGIPDGMSCYYVDILIDNDKEIHYALKQ